MQTLSFPRKPLRRHCVTQSQGAQRPSPQPSPGGRGRKRGALYATVISASVAYTVPSSSIHSNRRRPDSVATVKKAR